MSRLSDRIAVLSPEQRALLELKLKSKGLRYNLQPEEGGHTHHQEAVRSDRAHYVPGEIQFSLFYFSSDEEALPEDKYRLVLEGTRFADQHGFAAVWTPERHFHPFGGLYPNPSVLSAALAVATERIHLRGGSVVLPLHHPVRVAEEWSIVDNLSGGRVGLAFASGWHPNDFVFAPEHYTDRKAQMFHSIEMVRRLWQGEAVTLRNGADNQIEVRLFPKPVQETLPIWITAARSPDTFIKAGEIGANVLTALIDLSVDQLAQGITLYRESLAAHGYAPEMGQVTVMVHTFVGDDPQRVRETVRTPLYNYMRSHGELGKALVKTTAGGEELVVSAKDENALLSFAFERYLRGQSLIGTPETCAQVIRSLRMAGVNEIACLIDFGVDVDLVLGSLRDLNALKDYCHSQQTLSKDHMEGPAASGR